jgi:hypothetical protein
LRHRDDTYVLKGDVEHGDSMGNKGIITSGDMQWMTAGSGIIHQEMPRGDDNGVMEGFQLWANLPKSRKMLDPRYRDIKSSKVPEVVTKSGANVKVICGTVEGKQGRPGTAPLSSNARSKRNSSTPRSS